MAAATSHSAPSDARLRGRPATFDRDEAVLIALDLFGRHGYDGVSVSDLTSAIGIAAPSLYHAFGSKAGLYREALRRYTANGLDLAEIERTPSSRHAVGVMLESGIAVATAAGHPPGCMVSSGLLMTGPTNAVLAAELSAMRTALRDALARRIDRDVAEGGLPARTDVAGLAHLVASVLQGFSVQALDGASAEDLRAAARHVLSVWPLEPDR